MDRPRDPGPVWALPPAVVPFLVVGTATIVAGGLVAAVSRPAGWDHGPWVAAYLVLVTGVGQIGLGAGQAAVAAPPPSARRLVLQLVLLDGGSALVIAGTLVTVPALVTVGGVVIAAALVAFATVGRAPDRHPWIGRTYLGLLVLLLVSTPVGLVLAWVRA